MITQPYVLIVDDDPDARKLLAEIITSLGLKVDVAKDGAEALAKINASRPSLIMLDLMMPIMNGFEVLSHLRGTRETRYIPVVVVSAVIEGGLLELPGVSKVIRKAEMRVGDVKQCVTTLLQPLQSTAMKGALTL